MLKNNTSLSLIFGIMLLVGGAVAYRYGNFGGISLETLNNQYISKEEVTFNDLPSSLKERYIDKEEVIEQSKEADLLDDKYLDEKGNPIPESEVSHKDFRRMIIKLQKTLLFLQHDNHLISNEKNELLKKIEDLENEAKEERNAILNKNLEKINEAEQQHYKNISDLTIKINELQKENVIIAQRANFENNTLKSQIEELKSKAIEEESKKKQEIFNAREDEKSKLADYKERIKLLSDQIALLNGQITTNNETAQNAINRKVEEIVKLKEEITADNKEKHEILTNHAQAIAEKERKHNDEIAQYNKSIELIKTQSEQLATKGRQDRADLEEEHLKKIAIYEEKNKNLNAELLSTKKHIDALMLENEKDFNKFKTYLEDEKKLNKELIAVNQKLEESAQTAEKNLNSIILQRNEEIVKKESSIKDLENKIIALKNEKQNFDIEVKKKIDENDRIHNKNYKIFNEKIATFESSKREMLEKLDKQLGEYKDAAKENYDKMQYHVGELTHANSELKTKNDAKEKELLSLQDRLLLLKDDGQKSKEAQETKLAQTKSAFDALKSEIKQKESEYLSQINTLENTLKEKENALLASQKEVTLKIAGLEKELKAKELHIQSSNDTVKNKEEALKALHVKIKEAETNATKTTNAQIEELKNKLASLEEDKKSQKDEMKRKEMKYLEKLKILEATTLKVVTNVATEPKKGHKLTIQDKVTCTDMSMGTNAISATCKQNIQAFLSKYDDTYLFEVAPIVDNGGFASLKLIKSKKMGVEDTEIDRISGLANIGLGKARAKAGGELITQKFGESAKISYALSNIEIDKARGFEIRVYK